MKHGVDAPLGTFDKVLTAILFPFIALRDFFGVSHRRLFNLFSCHVTIVLKFNPKILVSQRGTLAHHEVMQLAFLDGEERAILVVQRADVPVAQHHVKG